MGNRSLPKILANTTFQILGKGATATTSFVVAIILGRFLGEANFGDFAKAFALVETFYVFCDFGANAIFVKATTLHKEKKEYFLAKLLTFRILISFLVVFLIFLITFFLPYDPVKNAGFPPTVKLGTILASATILTYAAILTAQAGFQLRLAFGKQLQAQVLGSLAKLTFVILIVLTRPSVLAVILAVLAGEVVTASLFMILAYYKFASLRPTFKLAKVWNFAKAAAPIGLSLVFNLFYFRGDLLILSSFVKSAEVGNYSLAYKFFEVSLVLPIFFVNATYPLMVKSFAQSGQVFKKMVSQYSYFLLAVSVVASIILFFAGPAIIEAIFKENFGYSTAILKILSLGLPLFYLSAIYMWSLIVLGVQKILAPIYGMGAILNLLANFIFIPIWGALAAAVITVVSEALILLILYLSYLYFLKQLNYNEA